MNESERSSQVSALFDGELDPAQVELVTRRLLKDASLRASWDNYALIGACLRGEPLASRRPGRIDLAAQVAVSLEREQQSAAPTLAPEPATGRRGQLLAFGGALAAGVAAVTILLLRQQSPADPASQLAAAGSQVSAPAIDAARLAVAARVATTGSDTAPSYTTPADRRDSGPHLSAPLVNYVVAHSEYTTPVARFSPLSAVMTGNFDPSEGTVEMTEAEVGARR